MAILDKIIVSYTVPKQNGIIWIRPIRDDAAALYAKIKGKWTPVIPMHEAGTPNPDDDTPWQEGGGVPGPNSVGTEQIIDNSVIMDDLNDTVKDKIQKTYYQDEEELHMGFEIEESLI